MPAFIRRARAVRAAPNVSPGGNAPSAFRVSGIPGAKNLQTGRAVATGLGASSVVFLGGGATDTAERGPSFLPRKLSQFKGPQIPEGFTTGGISITGSHGGSPSGGGGSGGRGFQPGGPIHAFPA